MNCDKCRWYKVGLRELTHDEREFQRLALKFLHDWYLFDTRACIMGGCDGQSKFEEEPNTFNALDALNAENKNGFGVDNCKTKDPKVCIVERPWGTVKDSIAKT